MASTSASSVQKMFKYDVFLSFRGEDTRKTFVDHLYHALVNKGIITYKDDESIEKGERISEQLIRSIEESRFYIIVFSKNYASSSWCLDELIHIMECQKMAEHTAYPIFFDVEPTEVRHQSGAVGEAFAKHVRGPWSSVLPLDCLCSIVASCCHGSSSSLTGLAVDLENEDDVGRWRNALKEAAGLAGMELKNTFNGHEAKFIQQIVEQVSLKLHFFNLSVDTKLVGMETRVKNIVSSLEIGVDDVRMIGIWGMGGSGKTTLARAVFNYISIWFDSKSFVENVREVSKGPGLKELQQQILQDVLNDQRISVKSVHDGENMMKKMMLGKKVLVVLDDVDDIEQLKALVGEPTWFTSGSKIIITTREKQALVAHGVHNDYIHDVSLLSFGEAICLFSRCAFKREFPFQEYEELSRKVVYYAAGLPLTITVLGSFLCGRAVLEWEDALERLKSIPEDQTLKRMEISYNGLENDYKEIFLDVACVLRGETKYNAVRILESCGFNARIGLSVLEQKSLITVSDTGGLLLHDLIAEMGWNIVRRFHPDEPSRHTRLWIKNEIEDILVNKLGTKATRSIMLRNSKLHPTVILKGLRNMRELRLLIVHPGWIEQRFVEVSQYLPDALRSLYWFRYPFRSLPKMFRANELVNLEMVSSNISELWEGGERKGLNKLRFLSLRGSMLRTFDLGMTPNLETLDLENCSDLVELHMLVVCPKLKSLKLGGSKLTNINLLTPHLETLDLRGCKDFVELHMSIECPKLRFLDLSGSKLSNINLKLTPNLEKLDLSKCNEFAELHMPIKCPKLIFVSLSGSKVSNFDLGRTPILEKLDLSKCNEFAELHMPIKCPKLKHLNLSGSKVSKLNLGLTPGIEKVYLINCYFLQEIHAPMGCLQKLVNLDLSGCLRVEHFSVTRVLPSREPSATLRLIAESVDKCPLHPSNNLPKFLFKCLDRPLFIGNVEKLISFGVCACTNLESFSASICSLQHLRELTLEGCIPEVPKDLYQLQSLHELSLSMKEIKHLPDSICMLKHLKSLELESCWLLEQLPNDLGILEHLELLNLNDCISLQDIPSSICNMKCLKSLNLANCIRVEKLPEKLGHLECLEELQLMHCTSLRDIPNSICNMKCLMYLDLNNCILVEKLPEELGRLECLKVLDVQCTQCTSHLPQSIYQLKGLSIFGSRGQLESYGFTSMTKITGDSYYIDV